ncbi:MAG: cytochrome c oxidase subunit II [Planctomycetes bacterium]|nr:cytochrome c oxidase subunit II [Planctomycetota bacterium]
MANIPLLPERASEQAAQVDYLFYFISGVTGAGTILVFVLLAYLCTVHRRKREGEQTPRILGSHKLEIFWSAIPLVLFLVMFAWGVVVFDQGYAVPADAPEVFVVGKQWMWKMQHPNGVREINELHLLVNQPVKITLISEDVIHSFGVPAFRDKIDLLPGRYVTTWYHPNKAGRYQLYCDQLCGVGHSQMIGWIHVMEKDEYDAWLNGKRTETLGPTDGSLAWEGRKLFLKLQCISCHNQKGRAPVLEGLYGSTVPLRDGSSVVVNENYIRESILKPLAKVHQGWEPIMPTFAGQLEDKHLNLSEEEALIRLIAFIKTLGPGQTPTPNEKFPPPIGAPTDPSKLPDGGKK